MIKKWLFHIWLSVREIQGPYVRLVCSLLLCMLLLCCSLRRHTATGTIRVYPLHERTTMDRLIHAIGDARVVLLGESTHGTHEFYTFRAALTKRLIEEKGFNMVLVEGDWVEGWRVNEFIRGKTGDSATAASVLKSFSRWPTWLWANEEMAALVHWMKQYNQERGQSLKIGFYGLDVYRFWDVGDVMQKIPDSAVISAARDMLDYFDAYQGDALRYASAVRTGAANGERQTRAFYDAVHHYLKQNIHREESWRLKQQAELAVSGEAYFRTMVSDRPASWNIRDQHMAQTVINSLQAAGNKSGAIVWVHNGHAGDARYADMQQAGYSSAGTFLRVQLGDKNVFSAGIGTYTGSFIAAPFWGARYEKMHMREAKGGSVEATMHKMGKGDLLLLTEEVRKLAPFHTWMEMRAIGAVYRTDEAIYGKSVLPRRFDAYVFFDSTTALHPLK